jgi:hypothetical protein
MIQQEEEKLEGMIKKQTLKELIKGNKETCVKKMGTSLQRGFKTRKGA